jgi:hypothetical protein
MIELSILLADEQCLWKAILKLAHQSAEIIALAEKPAPGFDLPARCTRASVPAVGVWQSCALSAREWRIGGGASNVTERFSNKGHGYEGSKSLHRLG